MPQPPEGLCIHKFVALRKPHVRTVPMPNNLLRTMMLAGSMLVSSAKSDAADPQSPALPTAITTNEVKGIVKSVDVDGLRVVVAHEAIRGYMDAMTMEFRVRQAIDLIGIKAGDRISFRLC